MASRKRKQRSSSGRSVRRRTARRTFKGRSKAGWTLTGQSGTARSTRFRTRKITGRRLRAMLYRDTIFMAHYRSIPNFVTTLNTPATLGGATGTVNIYPLIDNNSGDEFWVGAGGAQAIDSTAPTIPLFSGDVTLRGGVTNFRVSNTDTTDTMGVKLFLVRTTDNPSSSVRGSIATTQATSWDPSCTPDLSLYGKVLAQRDFLLLPGHQPGIWHLPHKVQKIDQVKWADDGRRLQMVVMIYNASGTGVLASSIYYGSNVSFSADATV